MAEDSPIVHDKRLIFSDSTTIKIKSGASVSKIYFAKVLSEKTNNKANKSLIAADSAGFIWIFKQEIGENKQDLRWNEEAVLDLSLNGAIWHMLISDINNDGIDELIIGGMKGAVIALTGEGKELWRIQLRTAISVIKKLNNDKNNNTDEDTIIIGSLDGLMVVVNKKGELLWSYQFPTGISDVSLCKDERKGIVISTNDGGLYRFFNGEKSPSWHLNYSKNIRALTALENRIIFGGDDTILRNVESISGNLIYERKFSSYIWNLFKIKKELKWQITDINNKNKEIEIEDNNDVIRKERQQIFCGTFSFAFLGAENQGIPNIGCYYSDDLSPVWETENKNIQIAKQLNNLIIVGATDGQTAVLRKETGTTIIEKQYNSMINDIAIFSINKKENIIAFACDEGLIHLETLIEENKGNY